MDDPVKVLILTADAGFGHRSAANAIAAALIEKHGAACQVEVINPLEDERVPALLRDSQADYDQMVRQMPDVYKLGYQVSDAVVPKVIMESAFTVMLYLVMRDVLQKHHPDMVVLTYPMYIAPLSAVITLQKLTLPVFTVITDLTNVHRIWFSEAVDGCLVPTQEAMEQARQANISAEKIHVTGIPIHPDFARPRADKKVLRGELGWDSDSLTLLAIGSKRVKNLQPVLHVLNHSGLDIQLVVVAGGDEELYHRLKEVEWHKAAHVYNYVNRMPDFMAASDCILSKAGGLTVTESLASGLPLLLIDITPGQEQGNAAYVIKKGAGELANNPIEALEVLFHWLDNNQKLLIDRARSAAQIGKPGAAFSVAEIIWNFERSAPKSKAGGRLHRLKRLKLKELLQQFDVIVEPLTSIRHSRYR